MHTFLHIYIFKKKKQKLFAIHFQNECIAATNQPKHTSNNAKMVYTHYII